MRRLWLRLTGQLCEVWCLNFYMAEFSVIVVFNHQPTGGELWDIVSKYMKTNPKLEDYADWDYILVHLRRMKNVDYIAGFKYEGVCFKLSKMEDLTLIKRRGTT